jgi:hypothetical protein
MAKVRGFEDIIARETIYGKKPDGSSVTITMEIGRPFLWGDVSPTEWACAVRIDPLDDGRNVHGEGALQPLCLAIWTVGVTLEQFQREGGSLAWEDGTEYKFSNLWPASPF